MPLTSTASLAPSWRLTHLNGKLISLERIAGHADNAYTTFEAATEAACLVELARLNPLDFPAIVPEAVTMRQARLALLSAGLLHKVNAIIAAMPGVQGDAARIEWEFSSEVKRKQALVTALGPALGMSGAQLDKLFLKARSL